MTTVLIVEDIDENQDIYSAIVEKVGKELGLTLTIKKVKEFEEAQQIFKRAQQNPQDIPALILLDMEIYQNQHREQRAGYELMRKYQNTFPDTFWIAITANELLQRKATLGEHALFDQLYELKPFDFYLKGRSRELEDMVRRALQLIKETAARETSLNDTEDSPLVHKSDDLDYVAPNYDLYYQIRTAAETERPIFLYGEPGTGKTEIAKFIHHNSSRKKKLFQVVDGKVEGSLLKKLLFENSDGKLSLLEQLRGGTIYIADFDQLGGSKQEEIFKLQRELRHYIVYLRYDVRLIAGLNKQRQHIPFIREIVIPEWLDQVISLDIPSLNERKKDIQTLVEIFLQRFNEGDGKDQPRYLLDAEKIYTFLKSYDWSNGNIALLKMVVEEALLTPTPALTTDDFKSALERIGGFPEGEEYRKREREQEKEKDQVTAIAPEEEARTTERAEKQLQTSERTKRDPLVITAEDLRRFGIR